MKVAMVTDASFCPDDKVASWSADVRSKRGHFFGGNVLSGSFTSNNSAEIKAVAHALRMGIERGIIEDGDHVHLQTDSEFVAQRLHKNYMSLRQQNRLKEKGTVERDKNARLENFGASSTRADILAIIEKHALQLSVTISRKGIVMVRVDGSAKSFLKQGRAAKNGASHGN